MINRTVLTGRLVKDPELRYSPSGVAVCNYTIAVNRSFDREKTDFIRCICFKKTAENLANYQKKGALIGVEGRIQTGSYEKEGRTIYTTEVVTDQVVFLETKNQSQNNTQENFPKTEAEPLDVSSDDLPF